MNHQHVWISIVYIFLIQKVCYREKLDSVGVIVIIFFISIGFCTENESDTRGSDVPDEKQGKEKQPTSLAGGENNITSSLQINHTPMYRIF